MTRDEIKASFAERAEQESEQYLRGEITTNQFVHNVERIAIELGILRTYIEDDSGDAPETAELFKAAQSDLIIRHYEHGEFSPQEYMERLMHTAVDLGLMRYADEADESHASVQPVDEWRLWIKWMAVEPQTDDVVSA